uniref:Uncharacterized protein n=1 Tax=Oryza meridionalis TaxID=40149 RepID=A0A0E0EQD4_9ORYZ
METDATISPHVLHLRRRPPPAPSSPATAAESQLNTTSIPPVLESPPLLLRSCVLGGEEEAHSGCPWPLLIFAVVRDREELRSSEMKKGNVVLLSPHGNDAHNIALLGDEARKVQAAQQQTGFLLKD